MYKKALVKSICSLVMLLAILFSGASTVHAQPPVNDNFVDFLSSSPMCLLILHCIQTMPQLN